MARELFARDADYFNCRLMPHSGPVLLPIVLSTLGLCASLADDGCNYACLRGATVAVLAGSAAVPYVDAGMSTYRVPGYYPAENAWRVSYSQECTLYADGGPIDSDVPWVAAGWFRFLRVVAGGTASAFLWKGAYLTLRRHHWRGGAVSTALTCLLQACSFVWFRTRLCRTTATAIADFKAGREVEGRVGDVGPSTCELFFGSKCSITACAFYGAAAAAMLCHKYPGLVLVRDEKARVVFPGPGIINTTGHWTGGKGPVRRNEAVGDDGVRHSLRSSQRVSLLSNDGSNLSSTGHSSSRPMTIIRPEEFSRSVLSAVSFIA